MVARDVRRLQPDAVIVMGGSDMAALNPEDLEGCVDWCVVGEGEAAILALVDAAFAGEAPVPTAGLMRPQADRKSTRLNSSHRT